MQNSKNAGIHQNIINMGRKQLSHIIIYQHQIKLHSAPKLMHSSHKMAEIHQRNQALEMCAAIVAAAGNYCYYEEEPCVEGCQCAQNDPCFQPWTLLKKPRKPQKWFGQILSLDFRPFLSCPLHPCSLTYALPGNNY